MDEEPTGVGPERAAAKVEETPAVQVSRLRTEIDATRDELGTYISELDRRRHEALDLKLQAKRHPALALGAGVAILGAVAGGLAMAIRARRHEAAGRELRRKARRGASPAPAARADPGWMFRIFLKAAVPIGIAVVTRLLSHRRKPRRPAAGRADGLRDFPDPPRYGVRPAPLAHR